LESGDLSSLSFSIDVRLVENPRISSALKSKAMASHRTPGFKPPHFGQIFLAVQPNRLTSRFNGNILPHWQLINTQSPVDFDEVGLIDGKRFR
jgi:hypothetical protein